MRTIHKYRQEHRLRNSNCLRVLDCWLDKRKDVTLCCWDCSINYMKEINWYINQEKKVIQNWSHSYLIHHWITVVGAILNCDGCVGKRFSNTNRNVSAASSVSNHHPYVPNNIILSEYCQSCSFYRDFGSSSRGISIQRNVYMFSHISPHALTVCTGLNSFCGPFGLCSCHDNLPLW